MHKKVREWLSLIILLPGLVTTHQLCAHTDDRLNNHTDHKTAKQIVNRDLRQTIPQTMTSNTVTNVTTAIVTADNTVVPQATIAPQQKTSPIKLGIGWTRPPYVFQDSNTGMELDIVRHIFQSQGYVIEPHYMPLVRVPRNLKKQEIDVALTASEALSLEHMYFSDTYITYQNVAVSLHSKKLTIESTQDLAQHAVVAFQNATKYLGESYHRAVEHNPKYSENPDQEQQVRMLFAQRCDVAVMDINIFLHYRQQLGATQAVDIHPLFPPNHYKAAFISQSLRDTFNQGLAKLRDSGTYAQIQQQYLPDVDYTVIYQPRSLPAHVDPNL